MKALEIATHRPASLWSWMAALIVAALAASCLLAGCGQSNDKASAGTGGTVESKDVAAQSAAVQAAAEAQFGSGSGFEGYAANDYVKPSGYHVAAVDASNVTVDGSSVSGTATITLENDSFTSEGTYEVSAQAAEDGTWDGATLKLVEQQTTARKGIDFDEERGVTADSVDSFDDNAQECTASVPVADSGSWIMTSGETAVYTYSFDGQRWSYAGETREEGEKVYNLKGVYTGTYEGATTTFEIRSEPTIEDDYVALDDYVYDRPNQVMEQNGYPNNTYHVDHDLSDPRDHDTRLQLEDYGNGYIGFDFYWNDLQQSGSIAVGDRVKFKAVMNVNEPDEIRIFMPDEEASTNADWCEAATSATWTKGAWKPCYKNHLYAWHPGNPDGSWKTNTTFVLRRS